MLKPSQKTIETLKFPVHVIQRDIDNGKPCIPTKCMHKVAVGRALKSMLGEEIDHVRVDAGSIRFNFKGYRWAAPAPLVVKKTLKQFDNPKTRDLVKPHKYSLAAQKTSKITKISRERQDQINAARETRKAAGIPDRKYENGLRKRIVGFA